MSTNESYVPPETMRDLLVQEMNGYAEWRRSKAAEHPEDGRNALCAAALNLSASEVASLPDDDARLATLERLRTGGDRAAMSAYAAEEMRILPRHGFDWPEASTNDLLDSLAQIAEWVMAESCERGTATRRGGWHPWCAADGTNSRERIVEAAIDLGGLEVCWDMVQSWLVEAEIRAEKEAHKWLEEAPDHASPSFVVLKCADRIHAAARSAAAEHLTEGYEGGYLPEMTERLADSEYADFALPGFRGQSVEKYLLEDLPNRIACGALVTLTFEVEALHSAPAHEEERTRTTS